MHWLEKNASSLRARTIVYPVVLLVVLSGLVYAISTKYGFDARIIRGKGAPFTTLAGGTSLNTFNLRLVNRTQETQRYQLEVLSPEGAQLEVIDPDTLVLEAEETTMVPLQIRFPSRLTMDGGNEPITIRITDASEHQRELDFRLLGPRK